MPAFVISFHYNKSLVVLQLQRIIVQQYFIQFKQSHSDTIDKQKGERVEGKFSKNIPKQYCQC